MDWLVILLSPIVIVFVYPFIFMIAIYSCAVFLRVYRHKRRQIFDAYSTNFWDGATQVLAAIVDAHGEYWHGYEIHGITKLPDNGPGLLIYYHGAMPIDMYYIMARLLICKKRRLRNVVATFLFHIPGFQILLEVVGAVEGRTREQCIEILKNGDLLAISPGGVREALFSDEYYGMIWNSRKGFAKVAMAAGVPIYPVFTQNVREAIRSVRTGRGFFRKLYEWTKLPLVPLYGGFPVKMRTFIGDPIIYDPSLTCEELTAKVQLEIQNLIKKHQRIPGSILLALRDRWTHRKKRANAKLKKH
ncbi:transmembrane protein 68-like [Actinia tenebrosa]|uniref:Transmembrane protein 68-like n=1 Tax=Actinia tenebrosa TaxID=6105 RepID=A0A6P8H7R4_ACTTE|nr:transmembrane protein 68-like [Actinia tenebrosa]